MSLQVMPVIAVCGPQSRELLQSVTRDDVSNDAFPYFTARKLFVGSLPCFALRVSYTGELGWEVYTPSEYALALWDCLWEVGKPLGVAAAGTGAFDSLRLEKGYRLWGAHIHSEYHPFEAGLGFAVKMNKPAFSGQRGFRKLQVHTSDTKALVSYPRESFYCANGQKPILNGKEVVGYVTSANYGYTVQKSIAYGYLPCELSQPNTQLEIQIFGKRYKATVSKEPLFDTTNSRLKS